MKKRWLIYFFLCLTLLLALPLIATQTPIFLEIGYVIFAVEQANNKLNGELQIGKINGNLFTELTISNVLFLQEEDTLARIFEIHVTWSPLQLLQKDISVKTLTLDSVYAKIKQLPDSSWNFNHLVQKSNEPPDTTAESKPFKYRISVDELNIEDSQVEANTFSRLIPQKLEDLNIKLAGFYQHDSLYINLDEFRCQSSSPEFAINQVVI